MWMWMKTMKDFVDLLIHPEPHQNIIGSASARSTSSQFL